jgi:hypothetical protein
LAGTLAVFENKDMVTINEAEAAIELMEFYIEQRFDLELGANSKNKEQVETARSVLIWIKKKYPKGISHNNLTKMGPSCYRDLSVDERAKIMHELMSRDDIRLEELVGTNNKLVAHYIPV